MSQRECNLLWLRDTLDQLQSTEQQLQWTENLEASQLLLETMIRDLDSCRRTCEKLKRRGGVLQATV